MTHALVSVSRQTSSPANSQPSFEIIWLCPAGVCLPCPWWGDQGAGWAVRGLSLSLSVKVCTRYLSALECLVAVRGDTHRVMGDRMTVAGGFGCVRKGGRSLLPACLPRAAPGATGSSPRAAEQGHIGGCQRLVTVRADQERESHSFWSTSKIPEDNLPWQCCPQPPPWHGVRVRRVTTRLLPASPHGLHPTTSCPPHFSGPASQFELFPSCIPLFQGTLAVGSVQQPWDRLCRQLPA